MGIKKISKREILAMEPEITRDLLPYIHFNPLIRALFWKRLEVMMELAEGKEDDMRILDFGCGNGLFLPTYARRFGKVFALDMKIGRLALRIREKFALENLTFIECDGSRIPAGDNYFDLIVASDVLEHFRELSGVTGELYRVMKKGASLIISAPSENLLYRFGRIFFGHKKPRDHYRSSSEIHDFMRKNSKFMCMEKRNIPHSFPDRLSIFNIYEMRK